jgi:hypothetical protein
VSARGAARLLPLLLVLAPALGAAARGLSAAAKELPVGDRAAMEMYTRLATEGAQLLGPYSRFHVHHPGPAFFYASAPLYALLGGRSEALALCALLWNAAALAVLLRYAAAAGPAGTGAAVAALLAFTAARGPAWLLSPWNPNLAILPFGAALFAAARVAAGDVRALPVAAVFASLAVQTHVATAPALAAIAVVAAGLWIANRGRAPNAGDRAAMVRAFAIATGALCVLWALPVVEQLTSPEGNLGRLASTLAVRHETRSPGTALSAVAAAFFGLATPSRVLAPAWADVLFVLSCGALVLVGVRRRRHDAFAAALALVCLAGLGAAVLGTRQAAGRLMPYLLRWVFMLTVAAAVALAEAFARGAPSRAAARVSPPLRAAGGLAAVGVAFALGAFTPAERRSRDSNIVRSLRRQLGERSELRSGRFLVEVASGVDRGKAVGLLLALDKRGLDFAIRPFGPFKFGGHWQPTGREAGTLLLTKAEAEERPVARAGRLAVAWRAPASEAAPP